ncbi:putative phage tail protein [Rhodovulum sp. P5]|uniref:phage tail length tape measure family protein n=1 Tax=Rhodovulum sp. P5 TaxID=1564506 RepID=UPI0009C1B1EF|nr:phage tail length tape measure family protein [Rhodovulum sp. P5]ARE40915.1 putative phage tail protein [Rhodovulum sp. P5]
MTKPLVVSLLVNADTDAARAEIRGVTADVAAMGPAVESLSGPAQAGLAPLTRGVTATGQASQIAAGQVANLGSQFNDIAMMMAAGQNPLMLAMQQGTQISQVLGPMGARGAVSALGAAFRTMVSPVSLATIAITAGVAAVGQWAMSAGAAGEETLTLAEATGKLSDSMDRLKSVTETYSADGLVDLREKYGAVTTEILSLVEAQREQAMFEATTAARQTVEAVAKELSGAFRELGRTDWIDTNRIELFTRKFGVSIEQATELQTALQRAAEAGDFASKAAALARIRDILRESALKGTDLYDSLLDAEGSMRELAAAAPQSNWLSGMIGEAKTLATALWDAAAARAAAAEKEATDDAGNPVQPGVNRTFRPRRAPSYMGAPDSGGSSGGGGAQADAAADLIGSLQKEIDLLRVLDPVQKALIENRDILAKATGVQRAKIESLIATRERETQAAQRAQEMSELFGRTTLDAFDALIFRGGELDDVLNQVIASLGRAAIEAAILGTGPLGGLFGGVSIFGGLIGGGGGALATAGSVTPLFPMAATGGRIVGPGTGTSDSIPAFVSNGEYIVNAAATERHLPLLDAINSGAVARFASGGRVGAGVPLCRAPRST